MSDDHVIRVVVIDDHEMILQSIVHLLQMDPEIVVVVAALSAAQGFEITPQGRPDIVIIDYHLADMDAPEAIKRLLGIHPEVQIITFSGMDLPGSQYASMKAGSFAWVRKARAIQELRDTVKHVVAGHMIVGEEMESLPTMDQLAVRYLPLLELSSGRIIGFEALIRWQHPQRGLLYPDSFLQVAQETGFIADMDKWVRGQVLDQLAKWQKSYPSTSRLWMSVNLSASEVTDPELFESISQAVEAAGIVRTQPVVATPQQKRWSRWVFTNVKQPSRLIEGK
jgi:CheY-like chemotaxis protein